MSMFSPAYRLDRPVGEGDHTIGGDGAKVDLVLYGDYECPYTARTHPIIKEILDRMREQVRFTTRYFPLSDIHPHAELAAEAAEAAAAQGKFWEMHEALYGLLGRQDKPHLLLRAEALGLDADRFGRELEGGVHARRVQRDKESGERSGVESTPTFYVNGIRYDGENEIGPLVEALQNPPES